MKKILFSMITLSIMALTAVLTFTNTYSVKDKLLMENVAALAVEQEEEDGCRGGWCSHRYPDGSLCTACCPKGQSPYCGPEGCSCS